MSKFVELPNSIVLDAEKVLFIAQTGVNEYHVIPSVPCQMIPKMDGASKDALKEFLGAVRIGAAPEAKPALIKA